MLLNVKKFLLKFKKIYCTYIGGGENGNILFVCSIHIYPPACYEKATVALCFGRIHTRLRIVHFRVFRLFLLLLTI